MVDLRQEETMERSWLVQRLDAASEVANPFSFGGGYRNGGLSDEAMGLLGGVWSFDYMGAAEFEFGAVPEALQKIAKAKDLEAFDFTIPVSEIADGWRGEKAETEGVVYVLCRESHREEVAARVKGWASSGREELKERTMLADVLRGAEFARTHGWLELNNGFLFFVDREMWERAATLFGVEVREAADGVV